MKLRFEQRVKERDGDRIANGPIIWLPFAPFIGLRIGSLTVAQVWIYQGPACTDCVGYQEVDSQHFDILLARHGWEVEQ